MHPQSQLRLTTRDARDRRGKVLALFAVLLPILLAITGLVLDSGSMLNEYRGAQHAVDAAATAAARSLLDGNTDSEATGVAEQYVREFNELGGANVTVSIPPVSGPLAGDARSVEVIVEQPTDTHFLAFLGEPSVPRVRTRAVARFEPSTAGAVLVVLDPDPPQLAVPAIGGLLPPLPSLLGGLEIMGVSRVRVDGAVHVNTTWGGVDENGNSAGDSAPPPTAIATPGLLGQQLQARDIRVVGGVDSPSNYGPFIAGGQDPLRANSLPVPDPLIGLPVPTVSSDIANVYTDEWGGMRIADIPLINPPRTLQPGVYDYLQIVSGNITFSPGVYVIRGVDPLTGIALNITGGRITADGVMFYITNTIGYQAASGAPDYTDGNAVPAAPVVPTLIPSTVIAVVLPGSTYRGLDDPGSPYDGMLLFQRRRDRRPVVIVNNLLLGGNDIAGTIYAKWGHLILSGSGFGETRAVAGTLRLINVTPSLVAPGNLLAPAEDVYLVE